MPQPPESQSDTRGGVDPLRQRTAVPSWLISALFHGLVLVVVALPLWSTPRRGVQGERTADVGIVLKHQEGDDSTYYEGADGATSNLAVAAAAPTTSPADLLGDQPPIDPTSVLPPSLAVIGPGALQGGGVGTAVGAERGSGGSGSTPGGLARTSVFDVEAEGRRFAYVFDRSGSMEGVPLRAAKAELIASIESLGDTHQFQIIFYNHDVSRFSPTGDPNRLFFATERNKNLAAKYIGSVTAFGSTDHEKALMLAINLQPDVIFFLTDADEPRMSSRQLAKIHQRASGITIHAIEFGFGPQPESDNFLVRLAQENGGAHGYVDISRLRSRRP